MTTARVLVFAGLCLVVLARSPNEALQRDLHAPGNLLDDPSHYSTALEIVSRTRKVYRSRSQSHQRAPTRFLRIGQLTQTFGPSAEFNALQMNAWFLWLDRNPILIINGEEHGVELIVYVDGTAPPAPATTTSVLTEWLVKEDRVHLLSTGVQANFLAMVTTAEVLGVPCINSGLYDASFLPPFNWSLYMLPKLQTLGVSCTAALLDAKASSFVIFDDPAGFLHQLYEPTIIALGGNITARFNVTSAMQKDPTLYDPIIEQIKALNPDVVAGSASEGQDAQGLEVARIHRMHRLGLNPKAILSWSVGSYPILRANLSWEAAGLLIAEAYQPSLNQSDAVWGNSRQYDADYRAKFGIPTTNNDAALAGAITMIVVGLNNSVVNISDPLDLITQLASVNTSSIFGPLNFIDNLVQRPTYCFQNTFPNAEDVVAVWPQGNGAQKIVFPASVVFPDGWFDQFKKHRNRTIAIVLGSVFGALGFLLIVGILLLLIVWKKYHLLFIPKDIDTRGEDTWGA